MDFFGAVPYPRCARRIDTVLLAGFVAWGIVEADYFRFILKPSEGILAGAVVGLFVAVKYYS